MTRVPPSKLEHWRELARETVADGRIFTVERSRAVSPVDGEVRAFHRIQSVDWVQILPITANGEAVLVRQYRHGAQRITLEMPGGLIDPGEDPATAALRECFEETGYRARKLLPLASYYSSVGFADEQMHIFLALGLEKTNLNLQAEERIHQELMPIERIAQKLDAREFEDAKTIIGLRELLAYLDRNRSI